MIDIFFTMSKRGGANNQVLTTLFKPPPALPTRSKLACASSNKLKLFLPSRLISVEAGVEVAVQRVEQPEEDGQRKTHCRANALRESRWRLFCLNSYGRD